jgi:hypothetical protein
MSGLGWFLLIAFSSVALASMTLRAIPRQRGAEFVVYLLTIALAALAGLGVAVAIDSSWAIVGRLRASLASRSGRLSRGRSRLSSPSGRSRDGVDHLLRSHRAALVLSSGVRALPRDA